MKNREIADRFKQLSDLMEIRGEDTFRIRSYRNAAETIESWPASIAQLAASEGTKGLQSIPGVGKAISAKIMDLLDHGTFDAWNRIVTETPLSVLDLLNVQGIGIKTAASMHQKFKISSLDDLKRFVEGGGLDLVDGIGEKTAERITAALRQI
jgi:DNA polymerase (family 10)